MTMPIVTEESCDYCGKRVEVLVDGPSRSSNDVRDYVDADSPDRTDWKICCHDCTRNL